MSAVLKLFDDPDRPGHGGGDHSPPVDPYMTTTALLLAMIGRVPPERMAGIARAWLHESGASAASILTLEELISSFPEFIDGVLNMGGEPFSLSVTVTANGEEPPKAA